MNNNDKGLLLVIGAYIVTVTAAIFIAALAILIFIEPHSCSTMIQALLALWGTIAAVFLASIALVRVFIWKVIPGAAGRAAVVIVYGLVLLVSYIFIAFGLMVLFNC